MLRYFIMAKRRASFWIYNTSLTNLIGFYLILALNGHVSGESGKYALNHCHLNPCKNGGTCYISSDSLQPIDCPEGFILYNDHCYKIMPGDAVSWFEASESCSSYNAQLAIFETGSEKDYIMNLAKEWPDGSKFWTNGVYDSRSRIYFWESTGQVITWQGEKEKEPRDSKYQRRGPPQICLALSKLQYNSYWLPDKCQSAKHNYICEMPVPPKPETGLLNYLYQCRCLYGYYGFNCEFKSPSGDFNFRTCENEKALMECPNSASNVGLVIEYASYGFISSNSKCHKVVKESNCTIQNTLVTIKYRCQGKRSCILPPTKELLDDPCEGTFKTLEFRIQCKQDVTNCPPDSFFFKGSCYDPNLKNSLRGSEVADKSWFEAQTYCRNRGGDLASISSESINQFLNKTLNENFYVTSHFWVGFQKAANSSSPPKWLDNEEFRYPLNLPPSSGCLKVTRTNFFLEWKIIDCHERHGWICRYAPFAEEHPRLSIYVDPTETTITSSTIIITDQTGNTSKEISPSASGIITVSKPESHTISPEIEVSTSGRMDGNMTSKSSKPEIFTKPSIIIPSSTTTTHKPNFSTVVFPEYSIHTISTVTPKTIVTKPLVSTTVVKHSSKPILSSTDLITALPIFCESDLGWEKTEVGVVAVRSCPEHTGLNGPLSEFQKNFVLNFMTQQQLDEFLQDYNKGFVFWKCEETLSFSKFGPCSILCYSSWQEEIEHKLNDINTPPFQIISYLSELTNSSNTLTTSSLNMVVNSFSILIDKLKQHLKNMKLEEAEQTAKEFTQAIVQTCSNILQSKHSETWNMMTEHERVTSANKLLKAMDESGFITSDYTKNKTIFEAENLVVKVDVPHVNKTNPPKVSYSDKNNQDNHISLPPEGVIKAEKNGTLQVVFTVYHNLANLLPVSGEYVNSSVFTENTTVNSKMLSLALQAPERSFSFERDTVSINLEHLNESEQTPICVFWNFSAGAYGAWDTHGCTMKSHTRFHTKCECNHLTNFAVLMDVTGMLSSVSEIHLRVLETISMAGCIISITFLFISVVIFTVFRQLWCDRNTIHRHLCLCLLVAEVILIVGLDRTKDATICAVIAGLLHYFFLAAFMWMFLEGFQLYVLLVTVFESEKSRCGWYLLLGYGLPAVVVAISSGIRPDGYGTKKYCWLKPDDMIWTFAGPILLVILVNIVFLTYALRVVFTVRTAKEQTKAAKIKGWLKGSIMLLCLLGVTWVFGYFFITQQALPFTYIFTILNSLQGLFIFIFHCVMNDKAQKAIQRFIRKSKLCPRCLRTRYGDQSSTTFHSTSGLNSRNGTVSSRLSTFLHTLNRKKKNGKLVVGSLDANSRKKLMKTNMGSTSSKSIHAECPMDTLHKNGKILNLDVTNPCDKSEEYLPRTTLSEGHFTPVKSKDYLSRNAHSEGYIPPTVVTSESNISSTTDSREDSAQL